VTSALAPVAVYSLRLADDALILCQQLTLWCAQAPELEEELAIANTALDLLGQARPLLSNAGDEDELAYRRDSGQFVNLLMVEQANGDFARTVVRQLLFSTFQLLRYENLCASRDAVLSGVSQRAVKEVVYHRDHATLWALRLGDGTDHSHELTQRALDALWPYTGEFFEGDEIDAAVGADPGALRSPWLEYLKPVLERAGLTPPGTSGSCPTGGRAGRHGPDHEALIVEMQSVHRAHPGASW
jgi:ring-1,2-phenylacetyl-CoA epoxidase subunit PaaC